MRDTLELESGRIAEGPAGAVEVHYRDVQLRVQYFL